jgi:1,4-alpha-glucan branching enzyme
MEKTGKTRFSKSRKITFSLDAADAREVYLAGEFNGWNPAEMPMKKSADGKWKKQISLPPGEFEYKFLVDDQWIEDPENIRARPNCFGTWNSLINITP